MSFELQTFESSTGPIANTHSWYAIHVQSKFEKSVSRALRGKGYEEWLPLYRARRQRCDRVAEFDFPLFPGYLFCRFDVHDRLLPILTTPGVLMIVSAGKTPIPISCEEIVMIQSVIRSGLPAQPWPFLSAGSKVLIERGPLAGVEGIVMSLEKESWLVVSIPLLQRAIAVKLERHCVRPIQNVVGQRLQVA